MFGNKRSLLRSGNRKTSVNLLLHVTTNSRRRRQYRGVLFRNFVMLVLHLTFIRRRNGGPFRFCYVLLQGT